MLELQKKVLKNVAENKATFAKELRKSLNWLNDQEIKELKTWLYENFQETHSEILQEVFLREAV